MKKLRIWVGVDSISDQFSSRASAPELRAQAEPFYKGKTIRLVVGNTTGGFYDRWGRLLSIHGSSIFPDSRRSSLKTWPVRDR